MIKTIDVECNAANPNLPLKPMFAFVNSPSSIRVRNVPKRIGDWCIRKVYFTAVYPDSTVKTAECVLTGGVWVGTIEGTNTSGTSTNGYTIFADGTDENGNNVTGYVLGKGDIEILEADGTLSPDPARYTVKLLSAEATQPREGDMYPTDEGYVIWQDGEAHLLGTPFEQITAYVESAISAKADLSTLEDYIPYTIDSSGYKTAITIGTRTPDSSVGQFSFSTGVNNAAEAMQTVAMGFNNKTQVQNSIAIGQYNTVAGNPAVAIGKSNNVSCTNGVSIGDTNTISGQNAVAIGTLNKANGKYAIAMGGKARANSDGSFTWSGSDKVNIAIYPQYFDHGKGTFNVNPAGGLSGFYIGEQSLNDILSAKADLSAIPTNVSQLSNDSGYVTSSELDTSLELKQDKLSADQTYVLDREVWDLYTHIQTNNGGQYVFKSPNTFDKSILIEQGILSSDGTTWIYPPIRVTMGSNVTWVNGGTFQNATRLLSFKGENVSTFQSNVFTGCSALNYIDIPNVNTIGSQMFRYCTALTTLTLPKSVTTVLRSAFADTSFNQVFFEGKTLAQVKAMTNYSRWGLAEDKIYTNAFENQLPTKTSELSNDSGFITSADVPTKTSDLTNDSGFITTTALTPYREKSDLYYEHSFHKANWQNVPRFIMDYDGTQTIFDKFDSTLDRWTVSTGTSDWYVQESLVGMEVDPQFTLMKLEDGITNILPTEGAGTTTVTFIDMGIEGTFTMDMSDQLVCKVYVDRQISALEARIAALEGN